MQTLEWPKIQFLTDFSLLASSIKVCTINEPFQNLSLIPFVWTYDHVFSLKKAYNEPCDLNHHIFIWVISMSLNHIFYYCDSQHNITLHSLISPSTSCKYSRLHFSHGTSVEMPSAWHSPCSVPQSSSLACLHSIKQSPSNVTLKTNLINIHPFLRIFLQKSSLNNCMTSF
jgi:hypothetical protein